MLPFTAKLSRASNAHFDFKLTSLWVLVEGISCYISRGITSYSIIKDFWEVHFESDPELLCQLVKC